MSISDLYRQQAIAARAQRLGIPEWQLEMILAEVPQIGAEERRIFSNVQQIPSMTPDPNANREAPKPTEPSWARNGGVNGWREAAPLEVPPGTRYVEQLCDAAAAADRAELERKLGRR